MGPVGLGCSYPNHRHDLRIRDEISQDPAALSLALLQSTGVPLTEGNDLQLLQNGKVFDALVEEIDRAQQSINVVIFIWRKSEPSDRILAALARRTAAGVKCRIVVDPFGSVRFDTEVRPQLTEMGCDVRIFRPMDNVADRLLARNHRKIFLFDGKRAVTGGFGIYKSWLGEGLKEEEWRDDNVLVAGPAVRQMQLAFAENWQEADGPLLPPEEFPKVEKVEGGSPAAFVASTSGELTDAERMTLLTIATAKKRLWIANAYFIPNTAIGDMMIEKVKQGVDVRVICPGPIHDLPFLRAGQRSTYARLLENGVRIWEYQLSMMHSKTILVDDDLVVVGSTNFDVLSMDELEEGSIIARDPEVGAALAASFERDALHSKEILPSSWARRGLFQRIPAQLTPMFGKFL